MTSVRSFQTSSALTPSPSTHYEYFNYKKDPRAGLIIITFNDDSVKNMKTIPKPEAGLNSLCCSRHNLVKIRLTVKDISPLISEADLIQILNHHQG